MYIERPLPLYILNANLEETNQDRHQYIQELAADNGLLQSLILTLFARLT